MEKKNTAFKKQNRPENRTNPFIKKYAYMKNPLMQKSTLKSKAAKIKSNKKDFWYRRRLQTILPDRILGKVSQIQIKT